MENLVRQFPIISLSWSPHDSSLRLILEVLSFELERSVTPSKTCSQNTHVSSKLPKNSTSAPNVSSHTPKTSSSSPNVCSHTTQTNSSAPKTSSYAPNVSSHTPKTSSSAPNDSSRSSKTSSSTPHTISQTPQTCSQIFLAAQLSPSYLEERTTEHFTLSSQNDTSTQENTLTEASAISQACTTEADTIPQACTTEADTILQACTTEADTILEENTKAVASAITQENITTQAYTTTQADITTTANYIVEGTFKCSLCDLVLRTEAELRTHNLKPHRYNLANKKFLSPDNPRIGQVNSTFLCPHCADLIPFNGRHRHMIAHQIDNFKSQWQNCQRAASLQQADGISSTSTGMDTTKSTGMQ